MARAFTVSEAADYLHVTPYTIRKWLRKGRIPGWKIGHVYRILEAELEASLRGEHIPFERWRPGTALAAHAPGEWTTDDFLNEKHEETLEEERRWKMRQWVGLTKEEKLARIDEAVAKYADAHFSSDDIVRERRRELEREERLFREHDQH